jgi:hypothetical protein
MQKMPQFIYAYVYAIVYVYGMYSPLPAVYTDSKIVHLMSSRFVPAVTF